MRQSKTYHTQYRLTDNSFRFWFTFVEPNQGEIEFGGGERVVGTIMERLPDYMGPAFEAMGRDWLRLAAAAGALPVRVVTVGNWWNPNHELDVVGLDERGRAVVTGEAKWHNRTTGPSVGTTLSATSRTWLPSATACIPSCSTSSYLKVASPRGWWSGPPATAPACSRRPTCWLPLHLRHPL